MDYVNCKLCPRQCGIDRTAGQTGFCGCPGTALVSKTMLHKCEEPALAGSGGSGAVFFGGCTLGCQYCQNAAISTSPVGKMVSSAELRAMMEDLIAQGAENIDLVTPTHYLPTVIPALSPKLPVPALPLWQVRAWAPSPGKLPPASPMAKLISPESLRQPTTKSIGSTAPWKRKSGRNKLWYAFITRKLSWKAASCLTA